MQNLDNWFEPSPTPAGLDRIGPYVCAGPYNYSPLPIIVTQTVLVYGLSEPILKGVLLPALREPTPEELRYTTDLADTLNLYAQVMPQPATYELPAVINAN